MDEVPNMTILSIETGLSLCERLSVQRRTDHWAWAAEWRATTAAASHRERSGTQDCIITARQILQTVLLEAGQTGTVHKDSTV